MDVVSAQERKKNIKDVPLYVNMHRADDDATRTRLKDRLTH